MRRVRPGCRQTGGVGDTCWKHLGESRRSTFRMAVTAELVSAEACLAATSRHLPVSLLSVRCPPPQAAADGGGGSMAGGVCSRPASNHRGELGGARELRATALAFDVVNVGSHNVSGDANMPRRSVPTQKQPEPRKDRVLTLAGQAGVLRPRDLEAEGISLATTCGGCLPTDCWSAQDAESTSPLDGSPHRTTAWPRPPSESRMASSACFRHGNSTS